MNALWGVLVAANAPTTSNGLLPYLISQRRALDSSLAHDQDASALVPQAQLYQLVSSAFVSAFFLAPHGVKDQQTRHTASIERHCKGGGSTEKTKSEKNYSDGSNDCVNEENNEEEEEEEEGDGVFDNNAAATTSGAVALNLTTLLPLAGDAVRVGRLRSNEIALPTNPCISGVHCTFTATAEAEESMASEGGHGSVETDRWAVESGVDLERLAAGVTNRARVARDDDDSGREPQVRVPSPAQESTQQPQQKQPQQQQKTNQPLLRVALSDTSTNGCLVNSHRVGKGVSYAPLVDGDVVELMNAGRRHTDEYNVKFTFYTLTGFQTWLRDRVVNETCHDEKRCKQDISGDSASTKCADIEDAHGGQGGKPLSAESLREGAEERQRQHGEEEAEKRKKSEKRARRQLLLLHARWRAAAQVARMYEHDVEDFYTLCPGQVGVLGEGAFGKVYRGALRLTPDTAAPSSSLTLSPQPVHLQQRPPFVSTAAEAAVWGSNASEVAVRRAAYIAAQACQPPRSAVDVQRRAEAAAHQEHADSAVFKQTKEDAHVDTDDKVANDNENEVVGGELNREVHGQEAPIDPARFPFAIKIVEKRRMLLEALDSAFANANTNATESDTAGVIHLSLASGKEPVRVTGEERALLEDLVELETQQVDRAQRWERNWAAAHMRDALGASEQSPALRGEEFGSDPGGQLLLPPTLFTQDSTSGSPGGAPSTYAPTDNSRSNINSASTMVSFTQREQAKREQREAVRRSLLERLGPALRKQYEREWRQVRRQQCEVGILLTVRHLNITRLYEVFDSRARLALVMEQALGGEAWGLLQPSRPPALVPHSGGRAKKRANGDDHDNDVDGNGCGNDNGRGEADDDADGLYSGGPLPEFLVKILIYQALEAVYYLHTMGIAHRDLKLENLLLERPCRVQAMAALQLEMLLQKVARYHAQQLEKNRSPMHTGSETDTELETKNTHDAAAAGTVVTARLVLNPLSPLHTVHIPRALWPVLKVTDFGLSWMLDRGDRPHHSEASVNGHDSNSKRDDSSSVSGGGDDVDAARHATQTALYSRHDMVTSCGTPIYAAPEVTIPSLRAGKSGYSAAVDLFSVGVVTYALLTGRIPFPKKTTPHGATVVDYHAPLQFERFRKRGVRPARSPDHDEETATPTSPTTTPAAALSMPLLPPIAVADSFRIPALPRSSPRVAANISSGGKRTRGNGGELRTSVWAANMDAVAERVAYVEAKQNRNGPFTEATAADAPVEPVLFPTTIRETLRAIEHYTTHRQRNGKEVDLELFYAASMARHAVMTRSSAPTTAGSSTAASAFAADPDFIALPSISTVGQSFLRGLLQLQPTLRMTAREALNHPWLQDCRDGY